MNPPIDRRGKSLTPGERFLNWCKGVVVVWPIVVPLLGLSAYGNSDAVKEFVHGGSAPIPVGQTVAPSQGAVPSEVIQSLNSLKAAADANTAGLKALHLELGEMEDRREAESRRSDASLLEAINNLRKWHE